MKSAVHTEARFTDDDAAREHLEAMRWPHGPVCPHCGGTERNSRLNGASHRAGLLFCGDCREQFTVTVGTVFERSKVALHKWVYATHLMCASKKGISAKQMERMLGVTYKTAWFMAHRIRAEAIFFALRADSSQRDITLAAARIVLVENKELLERTKTAIASVGKVAGERNVAAHAMWATHSPSNRLTPNPFAKAPALLRKEDFDLQFVELEEELRQRFRALLGVTAEIRNYLASLQKDQ